MATPRRKFSDQYTPEEYLAFERKAETKHEYQLADRLHSDFPEPPLRRALRSPEEQTPMAVDD